MSVQECIDQTITMLKLSELSPDTEQPRSYFDPDKLDELKKSIKSSGIITPLLYREDKGKKIIVSGEYRYRAAKELRLDTVPAQKVLKDHQIIALSENMLRNTLTAMEEARGVKRLLVSGLDRKEVMEKLGKAESTISEILKPTELPVEMQKEALKSAFWSRKMLLGLARIKDTKKQNARFEKMKLIVEGFEAEKKRRKEKVTGKVEPEKKETKRTPGRKITVFNNQVSSFHGRIKKQMEKKWEAGDKGKLKKELEALVETIKEFLTEQADEK